MMRFLSILSISFLLLFGSFSYSFAQEATDTGDIASEAAQNTPPSSSSSKVEYQLPYPGILPDNPLHILKAARDRLVGFLINDPQKKAEFNLLTSDKRINAASLLAARGKDDIAISTLSKSNNYLALSIADARAAQSLKKNVDTVLHNLKNAINKHQEVVRVIKKQINPKFSAQLQNEEKRLEGFEKNVSDLILE